MLIDSFEYGIISFDLVKDDLIECRAKERIPENAKSVITVLFPYNLGEEVYKDRNISRYSVPPDYHGICMDYLLKFSEEFKKDYLSEQFECFCDNSPIKEVKAANLCGLGAVGKNGLLINEKFGSYVFIGEIVTTAELKKTEKKIISCINCGKCVSACPTGSLKLNGDMNETCLSALTQKKGTLAETTKLLMKKSGIIWGCDICQEVCPMNKAAKLTDIGEFKVNLVLNISASEPLDNRAFGWRGRKVIERNSDVLL